MVRRQHQKRIHYFELNSDLLSNMPSEIITNILVKLPINEAVRTSILSRKWKYFWASIPDLVFRGVIPESTVDKVLLAHQGPILKFDLDCPHAHKKAINRWLLVLSQNDLKDLSLCFDSPTRCKVPLSLFSCHKLEHLELYDCSIYAPQCFQGLKFLQTLKLNSCDLVGITIEKFVLGCPLLETLELSHFVEHGCLAIRAPNLKRLYFFGTFTDLLLETPKLISASIFLSNMPHGYLDSVLANDGCKSKLLRTISALSNIEELNIGSELCEYLASGPIPEKLAVTFHHLKKLLIHLNGGSKEVDTALCIFRNAPNLKKLCLTVPSQIIWEDERITSISFLKQLEVVEVCAFEDDVSMLAFAKFILGTAPQLQKLVIDKDDINQLDDGMGFVMKLASFPRLSSKAVIVFYCSSGY
ncbi:F-box family protein [Rhynchospora pubera]|uniref:F-box family protein n=1 Tax=Rhynchospora pubera TaxID=906938 RepID=A0AAV8BQH7_9POAL|nr:F-box family protein [Rhynchospora pubera]